MELTINDQKKEPMLERTIVTASVTFDAQTPSRKELTEAVAKKTGGKANSLFVKTIYNDYGAKKASITAYQYNSVEAMNTIETHPPKPEEKKEEAAEEKPAEKPAEEKPEAKEDAAAEQPAEEKSE